MLQGAAFSEFESLLFAPVLLSFYSFLFPTEVKEICLGRGASLGDRVAENVSNRFQNRKCWWVSLVAPPLKLSRRALVSLMNSPGSIIGHHLYSGPP